MLDQKIDQLPNTSSVTKKKLKLLGINTFWDLLNYFPNRYEDYSLVSQINKLQEGESVSLKGQIIENKNIFTRTGLKIQKIIIADNSGRIELNWFNQPYLTRLLKKGFFISVAGLVKRNYQQLIFFPNEYEILKSFSQETIHTGRIIPIYPEKKGLSSRTLREKIFFLINHLNEPLEYLPKEIIDFNQLKEEIFSYQNIHFPQKKQTPAQAKDRLSFDELFLTQLAISQVKKDWQKQIVGHQLIVGKYQDKINRFINDLPFRLTNSQKQVTGIILEQLGKKEPMNHFLQGDVGSGKTVVAAVACFLDYLNGYQSLIMAPTEILANQHYQTLSLLFKNYPIKIGLLTGSKKTGSPKDLDMVIGTQALLTEKVTFNKIGLVVVDEQHRFGVNQRALLKNKGINPHLLTMTATPIPRTIALTLYGELNLSVIDEMPVGRLPVKTFVVPKEKRLAGYQWIKKQIQKKGVQVFVVCPLIEESTKETMSSVKAATKEYEYLKTKIFPELKIGLLHGKIPGKKKDQIMTDFKNKQSDILVSTSVVEVGIDISNANIIMIEGAERYGLAQLHQLRGRVGRGKEQAYCFVFTETDNKNIQDRLNYFARNNSGLKLAEYDLQNRGPGNIFGTKQHGYVDLKIALLNDYKLIEQTKRAVDYFTKRYSVEDFSILKKRLSAYRISLISSD